MFNNCFLNLWQMRYRKAYLHSLHLHAIHDKATLKERVQKQDLLIETLFHPENNDPREQIHNIFVEKGGHNIRSNVCCQDIDAVSPPSFVSGCYLQKDNSTSLALNLATRNNEASLSHANPLFSNPIVPPPVGDILLRIGVLTVSDRCFTDQYDSGDLSGPAVLDSIHSTVQKLNSFDSSDSRISYDIVQRDVVPDERNFITKTLHMWSMQCNMIFTTGGTGFAPRDVTPEATTDMLDTECQGLMTWASIVCSSTQKLAPLSRGTAGIRGQCVVVNLPGSPSGCAQVTTLLLPLLIHAVNDMNSTP
jgi:molybdopterin adenylyltransferase